jgi:eukaryotic-like serine/threonine-protein kinase
VPDQPAQLATYRIDGRLAEGGMGVVYAATHQSLGRRVALKVLHPHVAARADAMARFLREAQVLARLEHPHAVQVYDFVQGAEPFIVMELVEGQTLEARLRTQGPLPFDEVKVIAGQVLDVLTAAHAQGIVHRDLKPANLMLDASRPPPFVRVLDFGIAALHGPLRPRLTGEGQVPGTAAYMAPEQINAEPLDARCDLYALGCVLFELLSGQPPFAQASVADVLAAHLFREPGALVTPGAARVPPAWEAALRRALAKPREARFRSAAEMKQALEAGLDMAPGPRGDPVRPSGAPAGPEFIAAQADDPPVALVDVGARPEDALAAASALTAVGVRLAGPGEARVLVVLAADVEAGLERCEALLHAAPRPLVVLCAGDDDLGSMRRAIEKGVYDFMPMPLDALDLGRKVVRALRARRRE